MLNGFFLHLINPFEDPTYREVILEVDFILCQTGHQVIRTLEAQEKIPLQLLFCRLQLLIL